jgi:hypothetical protein
MLDADDRTMSRPRRLREPSPCLPTSHEYFLRNLSRGHYNLVSVLPGTMSTPRQLRCYHGTISSGASAPPSTVPPPSFGIPASSGGQAVSMAPMTSWRTPSTTSSARSTTSPLVWRLRRDTTRRAPANPLQAPCTACQGTWPHLRGRSSSTPRWHHYSAHHTDLVSPFAIPDTGFFRAAAVSASVPSTSTAAALPRAPS